jgi:hypothetical protein
VLSKMLTVCVLPYVPAAGENVGAEAGGPLIKP